MPLHKFSQSVLPTRPVVCESVIPNPKLRLLDQMREVLRLKRKGTEPFTSPAPWTASILARRESGAGNTCFPLEIFPRIPEQASFEGTTWRKQRFIGQSKSPQREPAFPNGFPVIHSGTRSRRICCSVALTSGRSRSCLGTMMFRRP